MPPKKRTRKSPLPTPSAKPGSAEQVADKVDVPRRSAKPTAKSKLRKDEIAPVVPCPHLEAQQETSPFLRLPRELRDEIYRLTLQHEGCVYVDIFRRRAERSKWWTPGNIHRCSDSAVQNSLLRLFRVSKQVYTEAVPIAMAITAFVVRDNGTHPWNELWCFLHLLGSLNLQHLTDVTYDYCPPLLLQSFQRAKVAEKLRQCSRLRSLTLVVRWHWSYGPDRILNGSRKLLLAIQGLEKLAVHVEMPIEAITDAERMLLLLRCPNLQSLELVDALVRYNPSENKIDNLIKMLRPLNHITQFRLRTALFASSPRAGPLWTIEMIARWDKATHNLRQVR